MDFTFADLCFLERCVTRMRIDAEEQAREFRKPPAMEDVAASCDQDVARATALLARLEIAINAHTALAKAEGREP